MLFNAIHVRLTLDWIRSWPDESKDTWFIVNCLTPVFEADGEKDIVHLLRHLSTGLRVWFGKRQKSFVR